MQTRTLGRTGLAVTPLGLGLAARDVRLLPVEQGLPRAQDRSPDTCCVSRLPWVDPDWLAEAERWIRAELDRSGTAIVGELAQPHVYWWSTVLRVPTSDGELYFKATTPDHSFEGRLTALLSALLPGRVPDVVAVDFERGWMLMRHGGTRLREVVGSGDGLGRWEELLPLYAELQIELAPRAGELLELGVPDTRLAGLPAQLARVMRDRDVLRVDLPEGLASEELARLRAAEPEFAAMCRALAGYGIPETLQHDDLHDGNVFVDDGRYVFFDWGDCCVSHPFHTLVVTLRSIAFRREVEPGGPELGRLRDAYLEPFARYAGPAELSAAFDLAYRVGTVARALAWYRFVTAGDSQFRGEDADAVPYGLRLFLAGGPIGSWR